MIVRRSILLHQLAMNDATQGLSEVLCWSCWFVGAKNDLSGHYRVHWFSPVLKKAGIRLEDSTQVHVPLEIQSGANRIPGFDIEMSLGDDARPVHDLDTLVRK